MRNDDKCSYTICWVNATRDRQCRCYLFRMENTCGIGSSSSMLRECEYATVVARLWTTTETAETISVGMRRANGPISLGLDGGSIA